MTVIYDRPAPAPTGSADPPRHLLRLRRDVLVGPDGDDVELTHPWGRQRVHSLGSATVARLARLAEEDTAAGTLAADPDGVRLLRLLERFPYLVTSILAAGDGAPLATAVPIARSATLPAGAPDGASAHRPVVLSRFAYLRRLPDPGADACVVESPLASYRVALRQPAVSAFVAALTSPRVPAEAAAVAGLSAPVGEALAGLLSATGFLEPAAGEDGAEPELWDFHDLLFHSRSRAGRHDYPSGGVFAHQDHPQLPAVPGAGPREEGPGIDLPVPDWSRVVAGEPGFTEVLEGRRSVRGYGDRPVTVAQLGELLYRAARVRQVIPGDPQSPTAYDIVDRPYPAGGSTGELELYLSVANCDGLEPGVYRYDAAAHRLKPRRWSGTADEAAFRELLTAAWRATNRTVEPQVLLTVTSRFGRLSWKYSQIAYALTLKHVGVLYQTLYLVATAMGLGPCGLGSGDTDAAARALGLDWTEETSVGEFLIGSLPEGPAPAARSFRDVVARSRGSLD
jgi:SagB-type dehydrogenase family enzyme